MLGLTFIELLFCSGLWEQFLGNFLESTPFTAFHGSQFPKYVLQKIVQQVFSVPGPELCRRGKNPPASMWSVETGWGLLAFTQGQQKDNSRQPPPQLKLNRKMPQEAR